MKTYISASTGFKDKRSTYTKDNSNEKKIRIHGICYVNDIATKFYLNEQTNVTLLRGRISIISPADGQILQARGKNRREKIAAMKKRDSPVLKHIGRLEAFNATSELYVNTYKDNDIKKHIEKAALKLYAKYEPTIRIIQKGMGQTANHTAATAVTLYLEDFINKIYGTLSVKTLDSKRRAIRRVAAFVSSVSMGDITQAMIKSYARQYPKNAKHDLFVAKHFWSFCKQKRVYNGENPLDIYFDKLVQHKRTVDPREAIREATELTCLPTEIERNLNNIITTNIHSGEYIGLLLVKECGLPAKKACEYKWKDIKFNNDLEYTTLIIHNYELVGAVHNYTRPITPFAAEILKKRYAELLNSYSKEELEKMYIASNKVNPEKQLVPKVLTTLCRTALIHAGIDQYNLTTVPGELYGAGIRLLLRNIKYRLEHYCGLSSDPAAVNFLTLKSLNNVTAEHYRSFTCPEGQNYLYSALKRDTRFTEMPESVSDDEIIKEDLPDGRIKYKILPESIDKLTSFKVKLVIKPGESVEVSAPQGIICSIVVKRRSKKAKDINILE